MGPYALIGIGIAFILAGLKIGGNEPKKKPPAPPAPPAGSGGHNPPAPLPDDDPELRVSGPPTEAPKKKKPVPAPFSDPEEIAAQEELAQTVPDNISSVSDSSSTEPE